MGIVSRVEGLFDQWIEAVSDEYIYTPLGLKKESHGVWVELERNADETVLLIDGEERVPGLNDIGYGK